jgi:hypothetical protein
MAGRWRRQMRVRARRRTPRDAPARHPPPPPPPPPLTDAERPAQQLLVLRQLPLPEVLAQEVQPGGQVGGDALQHVRQLVAVGGQLVGGHQDGLLAVHRDAVHVHGGGSGAGPRRGRRRGGGGCHGGGARRVAPAAACARRLAAEPCPRCSAGGARSGASEAMRGREARARPGGLTEGRACRRFGAQAALLLRGGAAGGRARALHARPRASCNGSAT